MTGKRDPWRALNRLPVERTGADQQGHNDANARAAV
jgi:hypothetical protein